MALGIPAVAAFDSGNLRHVAKALRGRFPGTPMVIAGDDDRGVEVKLGINPGKVKAEEASRAVGCVYVFPSFVAGEGATTPNGLTDFNDLARNSVLGAAAVVQQVSVAFERAIKQTSKAADSSSCPGPCTAAYVAPGTANV